MSPDLAVSLGHEAVFHDFPTLDASTPAEIMVSPRKLPTVQFEGSVEGINREPGLLEVEVNYYRWWRCAFLDIPDCGMGGEFVTAVSLQADGSFSVALPDYLSQPEIRAFDVPYRGRFAFLVRNRSDGRVLYELTTGTQTSRIPEQSSYPGRHRFQAIPIR